MAGFAMKLRLSSLLRSALVASMACAATVSAEVYLPEGVNADDLASSTRFYDGGKGRDWNSFASAATNIYNANGKDLSIFGDLASNISGTASYNLNFDNLTNDSGHCWAYTSSNMLQHWQTYYGVFAKKAGENKAAPVHGYNYDKQYLSRLEGTQSLKLNKLFYDSFSGTTGGDTKKAFSWYLAGENGWSGQNDPNNAPGYFKQYFSNTSANNYTNGLLNVRSMEAASESIKQHFGYTQNAAGEWELTTKGQIMHLELSNSSGSHAITCYGFETDDNGNIKALYVVNSDDAKYQLVKVYTKFVSYGQYDNYLQLHYDEECSGYNTYNAWNITGWSSINTPQVLKDMLAEYESGTQVWMGNLESWKNATAAEGDVNVLPTDETGWMTYAGTGTEHAGYYNTHYTTSRGVEFNDAASSGAVKVAENISVSSMEVNNSTLDYTFSGGEEGKTITVDTFTKTGNASVVFDDVKLVAGSVTTTAETAFDELHVTGTLSAADNRILANTLTLDGDATIGSLGNDSTAPTIGTTDLTINGGTTTIRNWWAWTNLSTLELSHSARLDASGASLCVSGNITSNTVGSASNDVGINTKYCLYVGTEGDATTGHVNLKGSITAGAYIKILGNANVTGNIITTGTDKEHIIHIGGNADIGGELEARQSATIGGNASIGGTVNISKDLTVTGKLTLNEGGTVGGNTTAGSLTLAAGKTLATTGNVSVAGALTGDATGSSRARVEAGESITLGGSASHVDLKAQTITMGAEDGSKLTLDSVGMEATGGEVTLKNVEVHGNCSFTTLEGQVLTLNAENVTFVLDESNSTGAALQAQPMLLSADPLTQTEVQSATFYLNSTMLEGVNVSGTVTLDLSHWAYEIASNGYDNIVLTFADDMNYTEDATVQASFDGVNYVDADYTGENMAQFSVKTLVEAIPEPSTATLSLLALTALMARRRRK